MGNELVSLVLKSFESIAFANGLKLSELHPIADVVVSRLEEAGYDHEDIVAIFDDSDA